MAPHSRHTLTKAEARYRALVSELKMLMLSFPHLREVVDQDELPVKFILRRGRDRARAAGVRASQRGATKKAATKKTGKK